MSLFEFLVLYIIGFVITLTILILFGKSKFKLNYDLPKSYANHDDYINNAQAYTCFSIIWFIFVPISLMVFIFNRLVNLVQKLINLSNWENE